MKELKARFKEYLNIEPSKEGADLTKRRGFEVINNFVENVKVLRADCVCAFELIEHIFNPFRLCLRIKKLVKDRGIFIMTTPNIAGFDLMILGKSSDNIAAPNHLNYFNTSSIEILLNRAGFKIVAIETPGVIDIDIVRNKYMEGCAIKDRFVASICNSSDEVRKDFQKFLVRNKLSSNMFVVAERTS